MQLARQVPTLLIFILLLILGTVETSQSRNNREVVIKKQAAILDQLSTIRVHIICARILLRFIEVPSAIQTIPRAANSRVYFMEYSSLLES
ncbi:hypothetical protein ACQKWADRAFT_219177 [Trichoderma austrokoningii]